MSYVTYHAPFVATIGEGGADTFRGEWYESQAEYARRHVIRDIGHFNACLPYRRLVFTR